MNPTIKAILDNHGFPGFIAFKTALLGALYFLAAGIHIVHPRSRGIATIAATVAGVPAWLISGSNLNVAGLLP